MADRALDIVGVVNDLRARMARLEALGAARWGTQAPEIGCKIRRSTNQSIAVNTIPLVAITFTDLVEPATDTLGFWNGLNRLTVPAGLDGRYICTGRIQWSAATAISNPGVFIQKNGNLVKTRQLVDSLTSSTTQETSGPISMAAGDYIELCVYYSAGTTVAIAATTADSTSTPAGPTLEMWRIAS